MIILFRQSWNKLEASNLWIFFPGQTLITCLAFCHCLLSASLLLCLLLFWCFSLPLLCKVVIKELLFKYVNHSYWDPPTIQKHGLFEVTSKIFYQSEICFLRSKEIKFFLYPTIFFRVVTSQLPVKSEPVVIKHRRKQWIFHLQV